MIKMEELIKALKSRRMNGYMVKDRKEAFIKVMELIDTDRPIAAGGSETLNQIGILDELRSSYDKYKFVDRDQIKDNKFMKRYVMDNLPSECTYLSGTNAITKDGRLINIDGYGNRVNGIACGTKKVIIVVGKNKIVNDLESGMVRVRNIAAPPNTKRLNKKTPCINANQCMDCRSPERICNVISIVEFQNDADRIHVIIVDEDLGY